MNLTNLSCIREILNRHGIAPQKRFGQNFLTSEAVVEHIADTHCKESKAVLEIGPGIGTMTDALAARFEKTVALEIDKNLIPVLADTLSEHDNVKIIEADALQVDLPKLVAQEFPCGHVCVCANLPYYITSPVIMRLLESGFLFDSITVMIQKEVADRLCAEPGSEDYGAITLAVNYYCSVEKCFIVSPGNFFPPPKVTSAVIMMTPYKEPPVAVRDKDFLFRLIRAAFDMRRKTLVNALSASLPNMSKEKVAGALHEIGLDAQIRGERLSLAEFAALSDILSD